jgi:hypothetical protein
MRTAAAAALLIAAAFATNCRDDEPTRPSVPFEATTATQPPTALTHTLLTAGSNIVKQKTYRTAAFAPAPNTLITVAVFEHSSSGTPPIPTLSGGGMAAWGVVATVTFDGTLPLRRLTIFRALSAAPGSGPLTITSSITLSLCQWIVSQWSGVDLSGANGAGAIGQTGSTSGVAVSGLTVPLAAFGNPNNVAYGAFGVRSKVLAVTPGAGFTEISEQPSGKGTPGDLQAEWAPNLNTIAATWTSLTAGALGVEIRAAGTPGPVVDPLQSTIAASPAAIKAGSETAAITVTVKDASGTPISGASVQLAATGGNTLTPAGPTTTDANGVATGSLTSTVAGPKVISATANGTAITQTATVTVQPDAASALAFTVQPSNTAAGATITPAVQVDIRDQFGNRVTSAANNVTIAIETNPSGGTLSGTTTVGAVGGVASFSDLSIAQTGTGYKLVASASGLTGATSNAFDIAGSVSAVTLTLLTAGSNIVNQRIYPTAAFAPAPNTLVTVAVLEHSSLGTPPIPTLSGGGMAAWGVVATVTFDGTLPLRRLTIFRALSAAPGSGPLTITSSMTLSHCQWIVSQWSGVDLSGANGAGAIVQTGSTSGVAVSGLTVPLAAFGNPNNVAYGAFGVRSQVLAVTPGAGFTEISELPSGESTPGDLQAEWAPNLNTIAATWTSRTAGALGVEIKAGNGGPVVPVASVQVAPASATVAVGGTVQLTATAFDASGEPLAGRTFTWVSDAPQVATVSATGLVTGVAAGPATISATSEGTVGRASVTVTTSTEPVASVEVTPPSATIPVGGTVQLTATAKDAAGQPLTGRTFTWVSNAPQVATVSAAGLVTGAAAGPATITATSEGKSGSSSITVTTGGTEALVGQWSAVLPAPIVMVHQHLLLDGRVLTFGENGVPQVLDPATGVFTAVPSPSLVFCGGHDFLPDGRILMAGGGNASGLGLLNTNIFDPVTASWSVAPNMAQGRWYPTNTTLPNGQVVTVSGADQNGNNVPIPEIWDGTRWRQLTGASLTLPNYPRDFVAPDGRIFDAGPQTQSKWLDVTGAGSWTAGPSMKFGSRSYGAAVMYAAGKILYAGGNSVPTNTAEIIDLNQPSPQWTYTGSMTYARWNLNATVLPDGQVLVTSGVNGDRSNPALAVHAAELWNPATGSWTTMASAANLLRGYHSSTLLLPDGRVVHAGGGDGASTPDNHNYEIYSPPYLFKGARPSVTGVTGTVAYGQTLSVQTPDGASITRVTLIRFGSVTHANDMGQLLMSLSFSQAAGGLTVSLPASRATAPPGPYMLFLVNGNGVPSVGRIMRLQ